MIKWVSITSNHTRDLPIYTCGLASAMANEVNEATVHDEISDHNVDRGCAERRELRDLLPDIVVGPKVQSR